ncbi:MAG: GGDEF domain-containing protein [Deltaproteobacteria bacterium]|nr:GGDEF domain-containing protein [Deltaproteobacteria bacterium]
MLSAIARVLFSLCVPGSLPLVGLLLYLKTASGPEALSRIVPIYPSAVLVVGFLLAWRFNRSQLVSALFVLTLADRMLLYFSWESGPDPVLGRLVLGATSLLIPINLGIFSMLKERGVFTWRGILRIVLIGAQVPLLAFLLQYNKQVTEALIFHPLVNERFVSWSSLPQSSIALFLTILLLMLFRFIYSRKVTESGFFWALITSFLALHHFRVEHATTAYLATAGLTLIVSVVEMSYFMAYRDELTGLPARRALKEYFLRLGSRYAVAMIDIDYFKKFNDRYGHDVGDQVLRMVASHLARMSGGVKVFRYGGEEFTAVFPNKSVDEAIPHLEGTRKVIETSQFMLRRRLRPRTKPQKIESKGIKKRKTASVTISIGVAGRENGKAAPDAVIKAADKALYRAKRSGRNRVSV